MKRLFSTLAALAFLSAALACRADTIVFTDSAGRTHTLPHPITRVYTTSPIGSIFVYTLAPETLVGINATPTLGERRYMLKETLALPILGGWFGKNGTGNLETLMASKPEIVLNIGDTKQASVDLADRIERQTGIPVLVIDNELSDTAKVYEMLGLLLGKEEKAKELGEYCTKAYRDIERLSAAIPESERVRFYYAEGIKGLETDFEASRHCEAFRLAGGANVCKSGEDSGFGRALLSMEQVLLWQPDAIFVGRDKGEDTDQLPLWTQDAKWQSLPAFRNKRVYQIPDAPFNWMDRPPSVNRVIGIRWAFWCLYPDKVDFDMVAETRKFFHLFYHYEMSADEARKLLEDSKLKTAHE